MDLELREKHEKLWFDIILRALDGSIVARSEKDIDILKKQFFDENGIHNIPRCGCYLCETIDYAQLIGNTFYGYLTKYKELLNG